MIQARKLYGYGIARMVVFLRCGRTMAIISSFPFTEKARQMDDECRIRQMLQNLYLSYIMGVWKE